MPIFPISCGIDLNLFTPDIPPDRCKFHELYDINQEKTILLFLGRIDGEKRIDLLIRAMRQLSRDDIQLVIAGKGRAEEPLHQMAADLQKNRMVIFTGFIPADSLPCLMNSVDIFVMPSEAELLSISTLEAMACGLPVLLADALALPELVKVGKNGYLFKPGDVADLVHMINLIADQPERWAEMGQVSREIAQLHSLDHTMDEFESLYKQLLNQGSIVEFKQSIRTTV
jgi:1,2-diacylglycerol 3-alpha-glucosyltransferase